jgi:hypothetical protein
MDLSATPINRAATVSTALQNNSRKRNCSRLASSGGGEQQLQQQLRTGLLTFRTRVWEPDRVIPSRKGKLT